MTPCRVRRHALTRADHSSPPRSCRTNIGSARFWLHCAHHPQSTSMSDVILHHYPESPFAEKVRVAFGVKGLAWRSVEIPRIMPKPDLMPLTGGYRKTPVMQIGADIYCDTQLIMLELERRLPSPAFLPKGREGEARAIAMWADRLIFSPAVGVVMSQVADKFGEDFKKDRSEFSGRSFDSARLKAALPIVRDQTYALLSLAEEMLADGRK